MKRIKVAEPDADNREVNTGPTTGAREPSTTWGGRPAIAFSLRAVVFVAPMLTSWAVSRLLASTYWHPAGNVGWVVWVAQLLAVGTTVVILTSRAARKLLPLAALYNLSLAFPDEAPSRFTVALRSGTIRNLEAHVVDLRTNGFGKTDAEAAQRVVELVGALGRHERLTRGHTERVRAYTDLIAVEMGLPADDRDKLRWSAMLHDIGKLGVPAEILNKAGRPTDEEWEILATHPVVGGELVEPLAGWLGPWRLAASQHHERWDGEGYPAKLAGTEISLAGRIVAVADAYDVITSPRGYKKPMSALAAREELVRCSGSHFDPAVVRAMLSVSVGREGHRAGALGWLAELGRAISGAATHTGGAAGAFAASTALASVSALGLVATLPDARAESGGAPATIVAAAQTQSATSTSEVPVHEIHVGRSAESADDGRPVTTTTTQPQTPTDGPSGAVPTIPVPVTIPPALSIPTFLPITTIATPLPMR